VSAADAGFLSGAVGPVSAQAGWKQVGLEAGRVALEIVLRRGAESNRDPAHAIARVRFGCS
jgi:hypothetical protein